MKMKNFLKRLAVIAIAAVICFSMSACVINVPDEKDWYAPDTPTGLYTSGATTNSISLDWDSSSGARGYYVYRSSSYNGTYSQVGDTSSSSYRDTGRSSNTVYYYRVAAYNNAGTSDRSSYVYAVTLTDATNYITVTGTPRAGYTLTATAHGSGWQSTSYIWGYNSSNPDGLFTPISGATGSTFTIPTGSSYVGDYIRAFRRHPSGTWTQQGNTYTFISSNFNGPIQR
jgi:hypothetical protein